MSITQLCWNTNFPLAHAHFDTFMRILCAAGANCLDGIFILGSVCEGRNAVLDALRLQYWTKDGTGRQKNRRQFSPSTLTGGILNVFSGQIPLKARSNDG